MTTQFANYKKMTVQEERFEGQVIERRVEFEFEGLDYIFNFCPSTDPIEGGSTLIYVGDQERGNLPPSEYANDKAWEIADQKLVQRG